MFSVGQASVLARSGGILPQVEHSGHGYPENRQPRWFPDKRAGNAKHILILKAAGKKVPWLSRLSNKYFG